jgi:hypothetical protein
MLHDVAAGAMYLHKRRYVHGDLRSPNLFVGLDGRVSCWVCLLAVVAGTTATMHSYVVVLAAPFRIHPTEQ